MEFLPDTLRSVTLRYQKKRKRFPIEHVKVYMMQMPQGDGIAETATRLSARPAAVGRSRLQIERKLGRERWSLLGP